MEPPLDEKDEDDKFIKLDEEEEEIELAEELAREAWD